MTTTAAAQTNREAISDAVNPLGLDGIEFIEYATSKPQALGQVLEMMGFRPVARHRSREVLLYRQGAINIIVNAHSPALVSKTPPSFDCITDRPCSSSTGLSVLMMSSLIKT